MQRFLQASILACLLCLPGSLGAQTLDFSRVDQLLQDSVEKIAGLGGGVSLLLWKDGEVVYDRSFNLPERDFSDTRFIPIASATKWLSGAVIMALVDRGLLSLDDRAGDVFEGLSESTAEITIRQMFSHTSGLPSNLRGPHPCVEDQRYEGGLAACVDLVLQEAPIALPGRVFAYGGNSMHIAGRMAELAGKPDENTGDAWDALWRELIADPLDMPRTAYDAPLTRFDNPRISGGAWSTGREYLNFLIMLLQDGMFNGERVLSEAAIEAMLADQTGDAAIVYSPYQPYLFLDATLPGTRYGVGVWREVVADDGSIMEASSQGAFGFSPWIDRERNLAGVLAVFSVLEDVYPTYYTLKQIIREQVPTLTTDVAFAAPADGPHVYPQPANELISVKLSELDIQTARLWTLRSADGRLQQSGSIQAGVLDFEISLRGLARGVYALNIFGDADTRVIRKLISVN